MKKIQQKASITTDLICPCCAGTGSLANVPLQIESEYAAKLAKDLRKAGYSLREIAKMLGYKYPNSIFFLLKKKKA